jgi:hypothetical protein
MLLTYAKLAKLAFFICKLAKFGFSSLSCVDILLENLDRLLMLSIYSFVASPKACMCHYTFLTGTIVLCRH